jgi:hypothetical protein
MLILLTLSNLQALTGDYPATATATRHAQSAPAGSAWLPPGRRKIR